VLSGPPDDILGVVQLHLQAIYQTRAPDVRRFRVDDDQLDVLVGEDQRPADEWVLVRESEDGLDLAVWIDEDHLEQLASAAHPAAAVEQCLRAFCAVVEGVSHFLLLIERARRQEPLTLLELETQAEVDKFVCASLHRPGQESELHARIFRDSDLQPGLDPTEAARYREAGRLAAGWCRWLSQLPHVQARLDAQRRFWRTAGTRRMDRLRRMAA
jgi:hypothetical protein